MAIKLRREHLSDKEEARCNSGGWPLKRVVCFDDPHCPGYRWVKRLKPVATLFPKWSEWYMSKKYTDYIDQEIMEDIANQIGDKNPLLAIIFPEEEQFLFWEYHISEFESKYHIISLQEVLAWAAKNRPKVYAKHITHEMMYGPETTHD